MQPSKTRGSPISIADKRVTSFRLADFLGTSLSAPRRAIDHAHGGTHKHTKPRLRRVARGVVVKRIAIRAQGSYGGGPRQRQPPHSWLRRLRRAVRDMSRDGRVR